ncbi:hypothetical protein ACU635_33435 [[Actinomadura] parvosata]|uniref:hypothetical protein n=1 Tax=[Actinomadura] parvosata TaxID=1955412 RepID=UPI00406CB13D
MRLRWRDDAYVAASEDAVHILTHRGLARIDGASMGAWIDRLRPYLDGEHALDELTAGLPPERRAAVLHVIELLQKCDAVGEPEAASQDANLPVVLIGVEPMLRPLVRAAQAAGLRSITVMSHEASADLSADLSAGTGLVLYAGDGPSALPLSRACAQRGIPFGMMVHTGDATWLLPPGAAAWEDVWRRLGSPPAPAGVPVGGAAARLVRTALAGAVPPPARGRVLRIEQGTWTTTWHACLPYQAPAGSRETSLQRLRSAGPIDEAAFLRRIEPCHDDHLGLFTLTEAAGPQAPLNVCRAVPKDGGPAEVGVGFGVDAARCDAACKALAGWAMRAVGGSVRAYEIDNPERVRLLPVAGTDAGLAAGFSWDQAVERGLADQCLRMTLAELPSRSQPFSRIDLTTADLGEEGGRCRDILSRLGELPDMYDLTGSLGVPVVACCVGSVTIGYFSALNPAEALGEGLKAALLHLQNAGYGVTDPLPKRLRGSRPRTSIPATDLEAVASRLRARGLVALVVPLHHDPAVAEIMPYLARVVVADA